MGRQYKFRAWEKELKEMITVSTIDFIKGMINTDSAWRYFHEVELMQYTGITDVNDTEIYEGDIVTADSEYDGIITNVVSWYRGGFTVGGHTFRELYNIEVVGNIHDKNYLSKGVNKNENK